MSAEDVIESCAGFTDESTPVGEAWAEIKAELYHNRQVIEGRRCDVCKHSIPYNETETSCYAVWCLVNCGEKDKNEYAVGKRFEYGDHYCKKWESK